MPKYNEMDSDTIWKLLDTQEDLLTKEVQKEDLFFKSLSCPKCSSQTTESFLDSKNPFIKNKILPNKKLRCLECKTEFNPYSGLITKSDLTSG